MIIRGSSLVSLDCPPSHGGTGSFFIGCMLPMVLWTAALLEALLLGGHTWQVVRIVVFQVSRLHYGSHLVMVGWVASLVVIADGAASTELSLLFCEFYLCLTCMCS